MNEIFFELLRIAIGNRRISNFEFRTADGEDGTAHWRTIYRMAVEQTVAGILFPIIEQLPAEQRPSREVLLQWYMLKERTVAMNRLLNRRAVETAGYFRAEGFDNCILKGQGIAALYPDPLLRTAGDIDIWLGGGREKIYAFARDRVGVQGLTYQHIHYPLHKDVEVEVHTTPGFLYAPVGNRRLQRFFAAYAEEQFGHKVALPGGVGCISVPTDEFNRVYILLHIYMHLFGEGIGLRQVVDYYYVLRQPDTVESKARTVEMLRDLRMLRFAQAMMWVQHEVLGLEEEHLLVEPDEREGRFLLEEIMLAGNFGKYDARIDRKNHHKLIPRVWHSVRRGWKFLVHYPHEMIWNVPFRTWQYVWSRGVER